MPHGRGHHGGGFHGGEFHGGGGFHHHHSNYGGVVYTGGFLPYRQRRLRAPFIFIGVLVGLVIGAFIGLGFGIHSMYTYGRGDENDFFSTGDSRLYGYSSLFCLGGHLNYIGGQSNEFPHPDTASLYLLSSKPSLVHTNSFFFNKTLLFFPPTYLSFDYYLYPGSKITVSGCTSNSWSGYHLILVKGKANFNSWRSNRFSWYSVASVQVQTSCSNLNNALATLVYNITYEDRYYVIMDCANSSFYQSVNATMSLRVNRTGYSVEGFTNQPNCTGSTGCSVYANDENIDIKYALVLISTCISDLNCSWEYNFEGDYHCILNTVGYVVVTVVPLVAVVGLCITVAVTIICVGKSKKKRLSYQPVSIATTPAEGDYPKMPLQSNPLPAKNPTASTNLTGEAPSPPYAP